MDRAVLNVANGQYVYVRSYGVSLFYVVCWLAIPKVEILAAESPAWFFCFMPVILAYNFHWAWLARTGVYRVPFVLIQARTWGFPANLEPSLIMQRQVFDTIQFPVWPLQVLCYSLTWVFVVICSMRESFCGFWKALFARSRIRVVWVSQWRSICCTWILFFFWYC